LDRVGRFAQTVRERINEAMDTWNQRLEDSLR
jgi:hypothetical protein